MKKGLIAVLGTIAFALAGFTANANAPFFTKDIPNVVIGDEEDKTLTADLNWFRHLNAFNLLEYVSDSDTTPTLLRAAFKEQVTNDTDDLALSTDEGATWIRDLDEGAGEFTDDPTTWGAKELTGAVPASSTAGSYWLSFEAILWNLRGGIQQADDAVPTEASPFDNPVDENGAEVASATVELLPWHNNNADALDLTGADDGRRIKIYVADEDDNVDSKAVTVFAENAGEDALSGGFVPVMTKDLTLWTTLSVASAAVPTVISDLGPAGYLEIATGATDPGTNGAYFARWMQASVAGGGLATPIAYLPSTDGIYAAKFYLRAQSQPDGVAAFMPNLRYGSVMPLEQLANLMFITSTAFTASDDAGLNAHIPDPGTQETRMYSAYWASMDWTSDFGALDQTSNPAAGDLRTWRLFFDILDINVGDAALEDAGTWRLTDYVVGVVQDPTALASGASGYIDLSDTSTTGGWSQDTVSISNATFTDGTGEVTLTTNGGAGYIIWQNTAAAGVPWEADKLIRTTASLSVPADADRTSMDKVRMRYLSPLSVIGHMLVVTRDGAVFDTLIDAPANAGQQPITPDTTAADYISYVPAVGGPSSYITGLAGGAIPGADELNFSLDLISVTGGVAPSINVTLHDVLIEVLDEPDLGA